jgi:subtilase family serine protease
VFSSQYGLPQLNSTNFQVYNMGGTYNPYSGEDYDWAMEMSLDVQWAHAIAPTANILLVEAANSTWNALFAAVNYARNQPSVVAISMSWGGKEFSNETSYDSYLTSSYNASFFVSAGDSGAGANYPAASPNVVAVGGTTLNLTASGSVILETAWGGSGGGLSAYESEPAYQTVYNIPGANGHRGIPDVSYIADPNTGVSVYDSLTYYGPISDVQPAVSGVPGGWWVVGGTSVGAPQWAAIQSLGLTVNDNNLYRDAESSYYHSYFRDITSGSNGYNAGPGYDYVTGLGSPLTTNFTPPPSISISPVSSTLDFGQSQPFTSTVSGGTSPYSYQWYLNGISVSGATSSSWTFTPSTTGIYTVYATATDSRGFQAKSATAQVNVGYLLQLKANRTVPNLIFNITGVGAFSGSVSLVLLPGTYQITVSPTEEIVQYHSGGITFNDIWYFDYWSGGYGTSATITITLSANTSLTAYYTYEVTHGPTPV